MNPAVLVLLAVLLIAANAFFVAVEFSLLAARRAVVEEWAAANRPGASSALRGMRHLDVQLAASQLGITVMSLLLGWLIEPVLGDGLAALFGATGLPERAAGGVGVAVALVLVALVHMVLGEMVPKSVALTAPERTAVTLAPLQRVVVTLVRPVVVGLNVLARAGTRLLRVAPTDELTRVHTPAELAALLDEAHREGELEAAEHVLLAGALGFSTRRVGEVMAPRDRLVTVPATATVTEAETLVHRSGHSRVLVTGAGPEQVAGFLHAKDLLRLPAERRDGLLPPGLVRVALRVRPDERLTDLLPRMRRARRHVAVVVDPDTSQVVGLVTMEDVLESIVGDIRDETDRRAGPGRSG